MGMQCSYLICTTGYGCWKYLGMLRYGVVPCHLEVRLRGKWSLLTTADVGIKLLIPEAMLGSGTIHWWRIQGRWVESGWTSVWEVQRTGVGRKGHEIVGSRTPDEMLDPFLRQHSRRLAQLLVLGTDLQVPSASGGFLIEPFVSCRGLPTKKLDHFCGQPSREKCSWKHPVLLRTVLFWTLDLQVSNVISWFGLVFGWPLIERQLQK